jgi:hypothetical protein
MKVTEASPGRLVLHHHSRLSEIVVILFMCVFGALAWLVFPVDYTLSMILLGCVILGGGLFLIVSVRTTIIFDRIHDVVLIRQKRFLRTREREVRLSDVMAATLLPEGAAEARKGGVVALALRAQAKKAVPLTPEPVAARVSEITMATINRWLGRAEAGISPLRA